MHLVSFQNHFIWFFCLKTIGIIKYYTFKYITEYFIAQTNDGTTKYFVVEPLKEIIANKEIYPCLYIFNTLRKKLPATK